ncbi:MAG: selenide, water dikinase SelD [Marinifilaceae bacterium]|jgi:selenide,water dikinase|nr:selenide, water dikinase SelD [Marinifilaceae bacterium]
MIDFKLNYGHKITPIEIKYNLGSDYYANNSKFQKSIISEDTTYYDLGNGKALVNTINYFPMIIEDDYIFGKFAACSSLNEIYSIGYTPISASIITSWSEKNGNNHNYDDILKGANDICEECNIKVTGGYTISSDELFFGLSVNGIVDIASIDFRKDMFTGNDIYITKPLGIDSALLSAKLNKTELDQDLYKYITIPNHIGALLADKKYARRMTNLSSLGLIGHIINSCNQFKCSAEISLDKIPIFKNTTKNIEQRIFPKESTENWRHYKKYTNLEDSILATIISTPIMCGGIMLSIDNTKNKEFEDFCAQNNTEAYKIGSVKALKKQGKFIEFK